jgi:hypothetical protein
VFVRNDARDFALFMIRRVQNVPNHTNGRLV